MHIPVMVGRHPSSVSAVKSDDACVRTTTSVRVLRHTTPVAQRLMFGALNVQSANNKVDEIMDVRRERALDVMLLSETWHDGDSSAFVAYAPKGCKSSSVLARAHDLRHFGSITAASPWQQYQA